MLIVVAEIRVDNPHAVLGWSLEEPGPGETPGALDRARGHTEGRRGVVDGEATEEAQLDHARPACVARLELGQGPLEFDEIHVDAR